MIEWTYPAAKFVPGWDDGDLIQQPGMWLDVIRAANAIEQAAGRPRMFGEPKSIGGTPYTETYEDALVVMPEGDTVIIRPLNEMAAATLGLAHQQVVRKEDAA